jgi:hypothetical protein
LSILTVTTLLSKLTFPAAPLTVAAIELTALELAPAPRSHPPMLRTLTLRTPGELLCETGGAAMVTRRIAEGFIGVDAPSGVWQSRRLRANISVYPSCPFGAVVGKRT